MMSFISKIQQYFILMLVIKEQNTPIIRQKSVIVFKKKDEMHIFLNFQGKKSCRFTFNCYIAELKLNELT